MEYISNKTLFKKSIIFFIIAVFITIISTVITYIINPDLKSIMDGLENNSPNQIKETTGINKVWQYIVNNGFIVPFQMFILSLIPIQFLYFLNIIMTVFLPGVLYGIALQESFGKGFSLIVSSVPHYVFEIFAFSLFSAIFIFPIIIIYTFLETYISDIIFELVR